MKPHLAKICYIGYKPNWPSECARPWLAIVLVLNATWSMLRVVNCEWALHLSWAAGFPAGFECDTMCTGRECMHHWGWRRRKGQRMYIHKCNTYMQTRVCCSIVPFFIPRPLKHRCSGWLNKCNEWSSLDLGTLTRSTVSCMRSSKYAKRGLESSMP
jgi:hypothetical protein